MCVSLSSLWQGWNTLCGMVYPVEQHVCYLLGNEFGCSMKETLLNFIPPLSSCVVFSGVQGMVQT